MFHKKKLQDYPSLYYWPCPLYKIWECFLRGPRDTGWSAISGSSLLSYPTDRLFQHRLTAECVLHSLKHSAGDISNHPSKWEAQTGPRLSTIDGFIIENHFLEPVCGRMFYFTQTKMFLQTALAVCLNRGASSPRKKKKRKTRQVEALKASNDGTPLEIKWEWFSAAAPTVPMGRRRLNIWSALPLL